MALKRHIIFCILFASVATASASVQVVGSLVHEYNLVAGQSIIDGMVALQNTGSIDEKVSVTLTDLVTDAQSGAQYVKAGTNARTNTSWVQLPSSVVTVPARSSINVPYRLAIPQSQKSNVGTYWGNIVFTTGGGAANTANTPALQGSSVKIQTATEYIVRVVTSFSGGKAQLKFQKPNLSKSPQGLTLTTELHNTGERWAFPSTRAEVYDTQGQLVLSVDGRRRRAYPGMSSADSFMFSGLKPGKYQVLVIADDAESDVVAARYSISVE